MNPVVKTALLAAAAVALALPASASAHASLVRTEPVAGAVLPRAPRAVLVVFDDVVRVGPGVAAVRNGGGSVLGGPPRAQGRTLLVPLRPHLADGDYSVRWSIVSDDGHLESGVLAFAVGAGRAPPSSVLAAEATGPDAGTVAARWLFLAGVLGAVGIALYALVVLRRLEGLAAERVALVLAVSAALAAFGAGSEGHRVGFAARYGAAMGAGLVAAVVVALAAGAATLEKRALRPALVLALGLAAVPSVSGHALDPGLPRVNVVVDVLHVAAAAAWAGVLLGLVVAPGGERRRAVLLAAAAVAVVGVTGALRAGFELLSGSQLWDTSYGRTLLVKTGIALAALSVGWLVRARLLRRAAVELLLVAGLVVAVALLVQLRPGRNAVAGAPLLETSEPSPPPPPPARDAVVVARELGSLGVALEAEPRRLTAVILSPAGGGLNGLAVRFLPSGAEASPCGSGCYTAPLSPHDRVTVAIRGFGSASFALPARAPDASMLVRRARAAYRALAGVTYDERLASDPTHAIEVRWRLEKPDRIAYRVAGSSQAVVIGTRRWDRATPHGRWTASLQDPRLPQPATPWQTAANAHILARRGSRLTVSFADPTIPAFFTLELDARTLRPRVLRMVASAHFMTDRYLGFSSAREIRPPR
jgi:copper transport protein